MIARCARCPSRATRTAKPSAAREARVRCRLLGVAAIVLAVVAGTTPAGGQGRAFSIDRFAVSITVHPDASLDVREAITFDFRGSHQAAYRVIPVRYPRGGFEFALRLDGVQVLDEQLRPLKTNVSYSGRYVRVKAWVPGAVNTTKTVTVVYGLPDNQPFLKELSTELKRACGTGGAAEQAAARSNGVRSQRRVIPLVYVGADPERLIPTRQVFFAKDPGPVDFIIPGSTCWQRDTWPYC